jgi:diaminohydroxyphosphoribosylaminopyrimidine deaminase/5-amino-6-(5-phosphoribosylamino)uracil reductase
MNRFMKRAFILAKKADPYPNPKVGAVLVKNGRIIGEGFHRKAGMPHAEIEAMEDAGRRGEEVKGAALYVTLEPCSHKNKRTPPCTKAIIGSGIGMVIYAMKDPNPLVRGAAELKKAGIRVTGPTDSKKAASMNGKYAARISSKQFVAIKMAMSADGKTATRTGDSRWIGCKEERDFVGRLRSEFDAVMVGAGTIIKDDPRLTARVPGGRDPLRIIIDGRLNIPKSAGILHNRDGKTIIAACEKAPAERIRDFAEQSEAHVFVCGKGEVDLKALTEALAGLGVKKILIEGGSELNAKAIEAGIVDRIYLFIAPKIIGGKDAKGVIGGKGIARVSDAVGLKNMKFRKVGCDLLLQFDVIR